MIYKIIVLSGLVFFCASCAANKTAEITEYPRMPDVYRKSDYKSISKRNPYGMSIYDEAEILAEEEYFGAEVVSLEESRRILSERKRQKEEQKVKEEKQ